MSDLFPAPSADFIKCSKFSILKQPKYKYLLIKLHVNLMFKFHLYEKGLKRTNDSRPGSIMRMAWIEFFGSDSSLFVDRFVQSVDNIMPDIFLHLSMLETQLSIDNIQDFSHIPYESQPIFFKKTIYDWKDLKHKYQAIIKKESFYWNSINLFVPILKKMLKFGLELCDNMKHVLICVDQLELVQSIVEFSRGLQAIGIIKAIFRSVRHLSSPQDVFAHALINNVPMSKISTYGSSHLDHLWLSFHDVLNFVQLSLHCVDKHQQVVKETEQQLIITHTEVQTTIFHFDPCFSMDIDPILCI